MKNSFTNFDFESLNGASFLEAFSIDEPMDIETDLNTEEIEKPLNSSINFQLNSNLFMSDQVR